MDNGLSANSPYRNMDSGENEIQPDFLKKKDNKSGAAAKALSTAEQLAAAKGGGGAKAGETASGAGAGAAKGGGSTKGAAGAAKEGMSASRAEADEQAARGLYSGGDGENKEGGFNIPTGVKMAAPFLVVIIGLIAMVVFLIGLPMMMIGAIDANLQKALGFLETVGILEKQGEHVTAEMAASGEIPSGYAADLAANGVIVGQVGRDGNFYQTNVYIADVENRDDLVAATGGFNYVSDEEGELALLYNGDVIRADEFVARVEADPGLYAVYERAADITAKYYYGKDVENVFEDMGISRGNFNKWESTGDYAKDYEGYEEILNKVLDSSSDVVVGGYHNDIDLAEIDDDFGDDFDLSEALDDDTKEKASDGGTYTQDVEGESNEITSNVAEKTKEYVVKWEARDKQVGALTIKVPSPVYSDNATERAAELLNTAVSAGEPYLAANAFIAIEEPIQRARIGDNGPVNQVMNTLSEGTSVSYQNIETGAMETKKLSILETENFRAAVSDSKYSKDEAANFGRDRVLKTTGQADADIIKTTTVTTNGKSNSSSVVRNGVWQDSADADTIAKANENINMSTTKSNSEMFQSVVGGNRIIEGGSFLSNTINQHVIGAMPSDVAAIAEYHAVAEEVLARKAEAERATLSPFDISSPYTFFGSIVHKIASVALGNYTSGSLLSAARTVSNTAGDAIASLAGTATAEGPDQAFTTMSGKNCETVGTVSVEGDLYCTSHTTSSTKYINYTRSDWKNSAIGGMITDDGFDEDSDLGDFVTMGMDRYATVGVRNAEVCDAWHEKNDSGFDIIKNMFLKMGDLYNSCKDVDEAVATGAKYTFGANGDANTELYSGYMLYDEVYSLLSNTKSSATAFRESYYAKHPRDDSVAGRIARISGLTHAEAEVALNYANYLDVIANYDASGRHLFGKINLNIKKSIIKNHSDEASVQLYAWRAKETEYADLRNLNFVV